MKDSMPMISIIIPVYNVAPFLPKCLDSVCSQTYYNLEIILVDDGSTDISGSICDEYARKDPRIRVIHKENQGLGKTRNAGMAAAQGKYMMFVDSDDWVDENICQLLMDAVFTYQVQSSMCAYVREYPDRSLPKVIRSENTVFTGREVQRILCGPVGREIGQPENMESFNSMWAKLYPAAAAKQHRVMDAKFIGTWEDMLFNMQLFSTVESMVYITQPCYHYRKDVSNSVTAHYKPDLDRKSNNLYRRLREIQEENGLDEEFRTALDNRIALNVLGLGLNCVGDDAGFWEKCRRVKGVITDAQRKESLKKLSIKDMPIHWKLFYFCAKQGLTVLVCGMLTGIKFVRGKA